MKKKNHVPQGGIEPTTTVKCAANWAIGALVELCSKLEKKYNFHVNFIK